MSLVPIDEHLCPVCHKYHGCPPWNDPSILDPSRVVIQKFERDLLLKAVREELERRDHYSPDDEEQDLKNARCEALLRAAVKMCEETP